VKRKRKSEYITVHRDRNSNVVDVEISDDLMRVIRLKHDMREQGIKTFDIFQDTLKDERRKQRKLEQAAGTRVFSQCGADYLISTRQYFMDFIASYMKHRHLLKHAIGIASDGPEWAELAYRLSSKGSKVFSGDFTDYGPRIWAQLVSKAFELINDWYAEHQSYKDQGKFDKDQFMRYMLSLSVTQTVHLVNNTVYLTLCGIPSGHPITTPLNDIVHHMLLRMGWIEITKQSLSIYEENVEEVTYGDDELVNISDEFADVFNCVALSRWYSTYDFKYTDASKVGNIAYQTLEEETFLKRTFKKTSE